MNTNAGCWLQVVGCRLRVAGGWTLDVGSSAFCRNRTQRMLRVLHVTEPGKKLAAKKHRRHERHKALHRIGGDSFNTFLVLCPLCGANQVLSGRVPEGLLDNSPAFQFN